MLFPIYPHFSRLYSQYTPSISRWKHVSPVNVQSLNWWYNVSPEMGSPVIFPLYPHFSRSYPYYIPILVGYIPLFPHHNNDCLSSCGLPQKKHVSQLYSHYTIGYIPIVFPWYFHFIFHDTPCKAHEAKDVSYEPGVQGIAYGAHWNTSGRHWIGNIKTSIVMSEDNIKMMRGSCWTYPLVN